MPVGAVTVAEVLAPTLTVKVPVPFILYVIVTGRACGLVNVTRGAGNELWQTVVVPLTVATGVGFTINTAMLELDAVHPVVPSSNTNW